MDCVNEEKVEPFLEENLQEFVNRMRGNSFGPKYADVHLINWSRTSSSGLLAAFLKLTSKFDFALIQDEVEFCRPK